jgi:hypothetical protein
MRYAARTMRKSRRAALVLVCLLSVAATTGCTSSSQTAGGGGPGNLCSFATNANNCWRQLVQSVDACLGADDAGQQRGTLSADGTTCAYASGRTIAFAIPLDPTQSPMDRAKDFTVSVGGSACLHFVEVPKSSISATGPDGRTLQEVVDAVSGEMVINCPDRSYASGNALGLFTCGDAALAALPGVPGTAWSSNSSLSLIGGSVALYDCVAP